MEKFVDICSWWNLQTEIALRCFHILMQKLRLLNIEVNLFTYQILHHRVVATRKDDIAYVPHYIKLQLRATLLSGIYLLGTIDRQIDAATVAHILQLRQTEAKHPAIIRRISNMTESQVYLRSALVNGESIFHRVRTDGIGVTTNRNFIISRYHRQHRDAILAQGISMGRASGTKGEHQLAIVHILFDFLPIFLAQFAFIYKLIDGCRITYLIVIFDSTKGLQSLKQFGLKEFLLGAEEPVERHAWDAHASSQHLVGGLQFRLDGNIRIILVAAHPIACHHLAVVVSDDDALPYQREFLTINGADVLRMSPGVFIVWVLESQDHIVVFVGLQVKRLVGDYEVILVYNVFYLSFRTISYFVVECRFAIFLVAIAIMDVQRFAILIDDAIINCFLALGICCDITQLCRQTRIAGSQLQVHCPRRFACILAKRFLLNHIHDGIFLIESDVVDGIVGTVGTRTIVVDGDLKLGESLHIGTLTQDNLCINLIPLAIFRSTYRTKVARGKGVNQVFLLHLPIIIDAIQLEDQLRLNHIFFECCQICHSRTHHQGTTRAKLGIEIGTGDRTALVGGIHIEEVSALRATRQSIGTVVEIHIFFRTLEEPIVI